VKVAFDKIKDVQTMYIDNISRSLSESPIWNNTIAEDIIRHSDIFAGGKGINVWPIVKEQKYLNKYGN
jgi:hypothetical protein